MVLLHGFIKKTLVKKKNIGSSLNSWLREEGMYEEVIATSTKRVVARQVGAAMAEKGSSPDAYQPRRVESASRSGERRSNFGHFAKSGCGCW